MGLLPQDYYKLTPVEFGLMYSGYIRKEVKRKKELRLLVYYTVKGYADPKGFPSTPERFWPIDEEDEKVIKESSISIEDKSDEWKQSAMDLIRQNTGG